jgi:hypothetical protein
MAGEKFDIDLTNKQFGIFGLRGGGKSWLTKSIMDTTDSHLVYDPNHEHPGYHAYRPTDRESVDELQEFTKRMVMAWKPALVIYDESNKVIEPKPARLPPAIADIVDFGRHFKLAAGYVARRPVQTHTDIVELADYLFIFRLTGNNDHRFLEDLAKGLGDQVRDLPKHHFVVFGGGDYEVHAPITEPKHPNHT